MGRVLWRERFRRNPPEDLGTFGGIGIVLMGDFAQLPPMLSSSLLDGIPHQESTETNRQFVALTDQQMFGQFEQVLRLRRIHRQKGADPYKESTMRLRDAAQTKEDHDLWHAHSVAVTLNRPTRGPLGRILLEVQSGSVTNYYYYYYYFSHSYSYLMFDDTSAGPPERFSAT